MLIVFVSPLTFLNEAHSCSIYTKSSFLSVPIGSPVTYTPLDHWSHWGESGWDKEENPQRAVLLMSAHSRGALILRVPTSRSVHTHIWLLTPSTTSYSCLVAWLCAWRAADFLDGGADKSDDDYVDQYHQDNNHNNNNHVYHTIIIIMVIIDDITFHPHWKLWSFGLKFD